MLFKFVTFTIFIDFDWMFVNRIEFEFFIVFSILNYIAFVRFFDRVFFECFELKTKLSKSLFWHCFFKYDLNVKNSFCIKISTRCANFFNCFDVFDSSLLLWIIENLKWTTFVVENVIEIECFEIICCKFFIVIR